VSTETAPFDRSGAIRGQRAAVLGGGAPACKGRAAFEGQSAIGGPAPVRDPGAADGHRTGLQMIVGAPASSAPRFGFGLQCRDATLICDRARATPLTLRVQRRAGEFEPAGQVFYATGKHNLQPPTLRRLMNGEGKRA